MTRFVQGSDKQNRDDSSLPLISINKTNHVVIGKPCSSLPRDLVNAPKTKIVTLPSIHLNPNTNPALIQNVKQNKNRTVHSQTHSSQYSNTNIASYGTTTRIPTRTPHHYIPERQSINHNNKNFITNARPLSRKPPPSSHPGETNNTNEGTDNARDGTNNARDGTNNATISTTHVAHAPRGTLHRESQHPNLHSYQGAPDEADSIPAGANSTMRYSVRRLLQDNATDEEIVKPTWRRGLDAYNDIEEIGKTLREEQKAKANALMMAPAINKLLMKKKKARSHEGLSTSKTDFNLPKTSILPRHMSTDNKEEDLAAPTTSLAALAPSDAQLQVTHPESNVVVIGRPSAHVQFAPNTHARSSTAVKAVPSKTIMEVVRNLMDMTKRPAPDSRSLQRRNALFGLDEISFEQTFKVDTADGCPPYIIEGYNRAAECIRFNVPSAFTLLADLEPLDYLRHYTVVEDNMRATYAMRYRAFVEASRGCREEHAAAHLYGALNKVLMNRFGRDNYKLIEACVMHDEDITKMTLDDFVGVCAFCERCFWRMFNDINPSADDKKGCRPYLEYLDFRILAAREEDIEMSVRMRSVLKSLS